MKVKKELDELKIPYELYYKECVIINEKGVEKKFKELDYFIVYGQKVQITPTGYEVNACGWGATKSTIKGVLEFFERKFKK